MAKSSEKKLQKLVDVALDAAVFENGYVNLMKQSPSEVADDLCTYEQTLEASDPVAVQKCVEVYQLWYWSDSNTDRCAPQDVTVAPEDGTV